MSVKTQDTVQKVITATGLFKKYGQVVAMNGVDFDLQAGEILAIIGDNGAGKSVLIKSLSGAVIPDKGTICVNGKITQFNNLLDARKYKIETVYQDLALSPALSIVDNLF